MHTIAEIKLIQLHERRLTGLITQKVRLGKRADPSIQLEIEDILATIGGLKDRLRRKLQLLKEQRALEGIACDPAVLLEIEDIAEYLGVE